jgi:polyhydroxyalkanoate synthesis regulator phasin
MPQTPDLNKYLDAGAEFVAVTRAEARRRAKELVSRGQLAQGQAQSFVDDLVEGSRRRADELTDVVRKEIQRQVKVLGIATKDDLTKLEVKLSKQSAKAAKPAGAAAAPAKQSAAKKPVAKKSAGKKSASKQATGQKPAGKKATGKKATGKKAATKPAAKRGAAKTAAKATTQPAAAS